MQFYGIVYLMASLVLMGAQIRLKSKKGASGEWNLSIPMNFFFTLPLIGRAVGWW